MAQQVAVREEQQVFREQLTKMVPEIRAALPSHISVDKFKRVTLTAINGNSDLLKADRMTLFQACTQCAQDGLLPDGREAAFVTFGNKVQYMPMVGGIIKRCRNSGDIAWIKADCVYAADQFEHYTDEKGEHFRHTEAIDVDDLGKRRGAYAAALTKDGTLYFEFLTESEIQAIKGVSKSGNSGPWGKWGDEMAKKSAIRRLAKRLPMSTEQDDLIRRDDQMYDLDRADVQQTVEVPPPRPTRASVKAQRDAAAREAEQQQSHMRETMRETPAGGNDGEEESEQGDGGTPEDDGAPEPDQGRAEARGSDQAQGRGAGVAGKKSEPEAEQDPVKVAKSMIKSLMNAENAAAVDKFVDDMDSTLSWLEKASKAEYAKVKQAIEGKRLAFAPKKQR